MTNDKAPSRELTRAERTAIRRLVKRCANYDTEYGCLPLDGSCYMLGKWWTGGYCRYFQEAVLPLDPALKVALTAPPVEGKANAALCLFLARKLHCSRSAVSIVSGTTARNKIVEIQGLSRSAVLELLAER